MIIPRLAFTVSLLGTLFLAACGSDATPIPNLTGTPRPLATVPAYTEPSEPINRLNAEHITYLGRLESDPGTPSSIISAAFAPNGTRLIVLDAKRITLWDVVTGEMLFTADHGGAQAVFYSPEKTEVFAVRNDGAIAIYDDQGSEKTVLTGHEGYNGRYAYDPINGWLALGGKDGTIRIWDVAARAAKATIAAHISEINLLAFSPDGKYLASEGFDAQLHWWDWETRTPVWHKDVGTLLPSQIAIAPDGGQIALAAQTQLVLYNTSDGAQVASLPLPTNGAEDVLGYTPDSQSVVAASRRAAMTLWSASTGQLLGQFPDATGNRISSVFSPNGELMLMAILDKGVAMWDLTQASADGIPRLEMSAVPSTHIVGVQWSADGYLIALLGAQGEIYIMGVA